MPACESEKQVRSPRPPPAGSLIVVVGAHEHAPEWPAVRGGAARFAKDLPQYNFEYVSPEAPTLESRKALVNAVLERQPVGICLWVPDDRGQAAGAAGPATQSPSTGPTGLEEWLDELRRRVRTLVTMGPQRPGTMVYAHVAPDLAQAGELLGGGLARMLGDRSTYVFIHEDGRSEGASRCFARFVDSAEKHAGATMLEAVNAWRAREPVPELIAQSVERFRSTSLIVTTDPEPWMVPHPRLRVGPERRFATVSAPPPLWLRLRNGDAAGLAGWLDGEIGYRAVKLLWQGLAGDPGANRMERVECELVTPDNLGDFVRRYCEAGGLEPAALGP